MKKTKRTKKVNVPPAFVGPKRVMDTMAVFEKSEIARRSIKTADGFDNFVTKLGLNNNNPLSAGTYEFNLITRNRILLEAAYRGSWISGKIVDCPAEDMTRAGVLITTNKGEKNLKQLKSTTSRLKIGQSLCAGVKWSRLYGGSIAVLQIKGQKLDTPLEDLDTIAKDQFQGIVIYDRWQLNPVLSKLIDSGPDMGLPAYYQIVNDPRILQPDFPTTTGQVTVHHSRIVRFSGIELPYFQAITEMMWGESILERLWDRLISFDDTTMNAANLMQRAQLRTVGVDALREIIAAGGEAQQGLIGQFEMMRALQTNEGLTLIDKNDTFQATAYSFAGVSDIMLQFAQQLSGAADVPLIRLFSQTPTGMSATGESDIRMYYDMINAQQEAKLRNGWEMILKVMWRSEFGENPPDDLEFAFVPLWQMSALDKANIAKASAETIIGAYDVGLVSKPTAMKDLRAMSGDAGVFSNISDEEIQEAEEEPPPQPGEEGEGEEPGKISTPVPSLDAKPSTWKRIKNLLR